MTEPDKNAFVAIAAIDFSELSDRALIQALRLCGNHSQAELHVVTVGLEESGAIRMPGPEENLLLVADANEAACKHVSKLVDEYEKTVGPVEMEKIAVYVATGEPAERIVALAHEVDSDVVVMGTHSRSGFKRLVLGSVAERVMRSAPCGVYVIRPRDFLKGEKVPQIDPPLKEGERSLRPFDHAPTYHYTNKMARYSSSTMPLA